MIDVKHLTKWYGPVLAVDDVSFHVDKGRIVGFLGPNGAGKSTTLKILTCYQPASSGTASVAGHDVLTESLEVRRRIGYLPETAPVYPEMRVDEYLSFRAALRDIPARRRKAEVDRVAQRARLSTPENMMRRRLGELSRGFRQRVGLAEVLLHEPDVLILDEPTVGLDPVQIREMRSLIRDLGQQHTIILSSHILAEVEQTCDELIIIAGGRIAATGTPDQLRRQVVGPSRIIAEVKGAEPKQIAQALEALSGVKSVQASAAGNWQRMTIGSDSGDDLRAEVYRTIVDKGWQLRELRREVSSLEDFFVQITFEQNVRADRRAASA